MKRDAQPTDMNAPANEWGCPWHAYNGYRHDEHYWAFVRAVNQGLQREPCHEA